MTKAETTTSVKQCKNCFYAANGMCPEVCQRSLFCPKENAKPGLSRIKEQKGYVMEQFETYFAN